MNSQKRIRYTLLALFGMLTAASAGCGDGFGTRYQVYGTVTYKDQPVQEGNIVFESTDLAKYPSAEGVIKDGKYTLTTHTDGDGAYPGDYKVRISARKADFSKAEANQQKTGGMARQDDIAKAYAKAEKLVPAKYELSETSGLTAKVTKSEAIDFKLTD